MFTLALAEDGEPAIAWTGAVARHPDHEGNVVAPLPGEGLIASYNVPQLTFRPDLHDGRVNGGVERWTPDEGWTTIRGLQGALPNGVAVSADGGTHFLADTLGWLRRATAQGTDPTRISLSVAADNLKWGEDGRLLTTGVGRSSRDRLFAAIAQRAVKATDADAAMADPHERLDIGVVAVDPGTLEVETLLEEHAPLGVPTTAVTPDGNLYLTSLFGRHLARLRTRL